MTRPDWPRLAKTLERIADALEQANEIATTPDESIKAALQAQVDMLRIAEENRQIRLQGGLKDGKS